MAIEWLAVLKSVPWSEVIGNAPRVAEGAKKLWNAVSRKRAAVEAPVADAQPAPSSEAQAIAALESRVAAMEAAAEDLHAQMLASSELIKALAEQNGQLIARLEALRTRVAWLTFAVTGVAIVGLVQVLFRGAA
jgi:hypothetical protein